MIYLSAGHNSQSKSIKQDPGAVNKNGVKEGDLTIEMRNLTSQVLKMRGIPFMNDSDEESLAMYLKRIQTGSGSVVLEYHFDAAGTDEARGCTALIGEDADRFDKLFAKELVDVTADIMITKNRGVISETESHRGRLGLMREKGTVCLLEVGFITNPTDLVGYQKNKNALAMAHADILIKYEKLNF